MMRDVRFCNTLALLFSVAGAVGAVDAAQACSLQFTSPARGSTVMSATVGVSGTGSGTANPGDLGQVTATLNGQVFFQQSGVFTSLIEFLGSGAASVTLQPGGNLFSVEGSAGSCSASDSMVVYYTPLPAISKNNGPPDDCGSVRGNPCNAATGNKFETEPDDTGAVAQVRYYNSQFTGDVRFGFGWTSSLSGKSLTVVGSTVHVVRADAKGETFTCDTTICTGDADTHLALVQEVSGYTLTVKRSGALERYDAGGKLLSETDSAGRTTGYGYDGTGRVSTVTGPFGHTLTLGYDANDHVASVTDAAGQFTRYDYDTGNNLIRVTHPDGTGKLYHYEDTRFPHHLTGISYLDAGGAESRYATYGYDSTGNAALSEHAGSAKHFGFVYDSDTQTTVTDAAGTSEVMSFQTQLGLKSLVGLVNQSDGKSLNQVFDAQNNVICRKDEEGRVTTYTYNATNQRTGMTEGLTGDCAAPASVPGVTRSSGYQYLSATLDLPTLIESPSVHAGSVKRTDISYQGNLPTAIIQSGYTPGGSAVSRTVALQYNGSGQVTRLDGPRTDVSDLTTLSYNECISGIGCGQLASVTNALGHTTVFDAYDGNGRLLQTTDANSLRTGYQYDPRGRVRFVTQTPPTGSARVTEYRYDAAGNVIFTAFPDGTTLTYLYDAAQQLIRITDNAGNYVSYGYDLKGNRTQEYTHDSSDTLVRQIDNAFDARNHLAAVNAAGSLTQQIHDAVGNLVQVTDPNSSPPAQHQYDPLNRLLSTVDALSGITGYAYDANDRLQQVQAPNSATTHYQHDDLGNLLEEISPDRGTTVYSHDEAGNVHTLTDARGIAVSYSYDALNRPTAFTYPTAAENVSFTYDAGTNCTAGVGRLCQVQDESGVTQYGYDSFGNVVTQVKQELGRTYTTAYTYDTADRVTSITTPGNRLISYIRDALGRISSVSLAVNASKQTIVSGRTYRADGRLTSQTFGNGLAELRQHDLQGRLTNQSLGAADTRVYDYDANGNVVRRQSLPEVADYTYDALDRLMGETMPGNTNAFTYDANGNRTGDLYANGTPRSYGYATASNRLTQAGSQTVVLDAAGYTLSDHNGKRVFAWNNAGHLRRVTWQGAVKGIYAYNHLGQRTQKVRSSATGATARFVYHYDLQGKLLAETRPNGTLLRVYVWADQEPLAQLQNRPALQTEELVYVHTDHLQTPRIATDAAQTVVWRFASEAFGAGPPQTDPDENDQNTFVRLRFPGQYADGESGLYYNWNRYYDPGNGRYTQSDPVGLVGGINTYAYVSGNPIRYIDPLGLSEAVFDRSAGVITLYPSNYVVPPRQFPAANNTVRPNADPYVPEANGPAPNGTFPTGPRVPTGNNPNSSFGSGFIPIHLPARVPLLPRSGVGLHSGRANRGGPHAKTLGCIRTTDPALDFILNDPLTEITIVD